MPATLQKKWVRLAISIEEHRDAKKNHFINYDSLLETLLEKKELREKIRIKDTESKEESMKLLKSGEFDAMMAPKEVWLYLAKKLDVKIRILAEAEI